MNSRLARILSLVAVLLFVAARTAAAADQWLLADGKAWPGQLLRAHDDRIDVAFARGNSTSDQVVPRIQSITKLADGRVVFCSGLDRKLFELTPTGERELREGGYLVRQVRTDTDGTLYWSGLETPRDNNPLPDGFIYSWNPKTGEAKTVMTFSQGDVGHDWWGAFDVRDGRIFVGTITGPTRIFDVTASPVKPIATLPISATAFRFSADGSLLACDGQGKLYRFSDLAQPDKYEVVLTSATPFVDFAMQSAGPR